MHPNVIVARHYRTADPLALTLGSGCIQRITPAPPGSDPIPWVAPALVDLQVNGFAGVDFQSATATAADARHLAAGLLAAGVTRCLPTLITDDWDVMLHRLAHWRALAAEVPAFGQLVGGWHLEGPFLSAEPGFRGAHDPRFMRDPDPALLPALRTAAGECPVLLTLAPERPGSSETIRAARELGCRVNLGHSNASAGELDAALKAGATGFTHLGNACPQSLDRHDNILWRVLDLVATASLTVSLIPDGHHVSPALFRLLHRVLPAERLHYVSDAMSAAASAPGRYRLGALEVESGADGVVRLPGTRHFAGSSLRPLDGVIRAAAMLRRSWRECWDAFSVVPARRMGWVWGLVEGGPADFCLLEPGALDAGISTASSGFHARVFKAGQEIQ